MRRIFLSAIRYSTAFNAQKCYQFRYDLEIESIYDQWWGRPNFFAVLIPMNTPMMTSARLCGVAKMMTIVEMRIALIYIWGSVGRVGPLTVWLGGLLFSLLLSTSLLKCAFTLCTVWALCKSGGGVSKIREWATFVSQTPPNSGTCLITNAGCQEQHKLKHN